MRTTIMAALVAFFATPAFSQTVLNCESVRNCGIADEFCVTAVIIQHDENYVGAATIFYIRGEQELSQSFPIKRSFQSNEWVTLFDSGERQDTLGDNWFALIDTSYGYSIGVLNWKDLDAYSEFKCTK